MLAALYGPCTKSCDNNMQVTNLEKSAKAASERAKHGDGMNIGAVSENEHFVSDARLEQEQIIRWVFN